MVKYFRPVGRYRTYECNKHEGYHGIDSCLIERGYKKHELVEETYLRKKIPFGSPYDFDDTLLSYATYEKNGRFFTVHSYNSYNIHAPTGALYDLTISEIELEQK